jgi:phospholipid/cholesterol/gamma-HCH transport system substrate-binding protein
MSPLNDPEPLPPAPRLEVTALVLLAFMLALVLGSAVYVMFARGAFESTQKLFLVADDSEGVVIGMDMTFSGFPIGRVSRVELAPDGKARILVEVPVKQAHWLRQSSVFTLVRGLVGSTNIRAYSGILSDPPLADGAVREVLRGDATADIPRLITATREMVETVHALVRSEGALGASLANVQQLTDKLKGPRGALGVLLGSDADANKLLLALERSNTLLARLDALALNANTQVFGPDGLLPETRASVLELKSLLAEARGSLKRVDAVLVEAQAVGANARLATEDLGVLRLEVESSLVKVQSLLNEINRKWPFARDTELKLP